MTLKKFTCKSGEVVTIETDEAADYATIVRNAHGNQVGELKFRLIDCDQHESLKLCWAYLDRSGRQYLRQGIGRACLKQVRQLSGLQIIAEEHDGVPQDDGSHLTGDAPSFVARMRQERLIAFNYSEENSINSDTDS